jgi:hypothetical protein
MDKRKGLFILIGECFREGLTHSRVRDTAKGINNQGESSCSHAKLIENLNRRGYTIDVGINTCDTKYKEKLLGFYNNVVYTNFNNGGYSGTRDVVEHSIKNVLSSLKKDDYEFIFVCRLDLLLKDDLIKLFNPEWPCITYPNIMHIDIGANYPHISDLFVFIPKKYFNPFDKWEGLLINAHHILHHHAAQSLLSSGLTLDNIDFVTDLLYVANTIQMANPLYAINSRPEGPSLNHRRKYVKDKHMIIDI